MLKDLKFFISYIGEIEIFRKIYGVAGSDRSMNDIQDKDIAERWALRSIEEAHMSADDFYTIVEVGFNTCKNFCKSRYICGDEACRCIRSLFPHPKHYEQYLLIEGLKTKVMGTVALTRIGEKTFD